MDKDPFMVAMNLMGADIIINTGRNRSSEYSFAPNRKLYKHEEYFHSCYLRMAQVHTLLKQLDQSAILMANFRTTKSLKKEKINRFDFLIYHLESYFLRITGEFDMICEHLTSYLRQ